MEEDSIHLVLSYTRRILLSRLMKAVEEGGGHKERFLGVWRMENHILEIR